jgi:protocatechuate 3,4-dioxygenase beta subunit
MAIHHDDDDHDRGLAFDLDTTRSRRSMLKWIGGAGLFAFVSSCVGGGDESGVDAGSDAGSGSGGTCTTIPEETAGPYPGDGSNGPNVLATSGVVRSDITTSFGGLSGTATGVPLTMKLRLVDASGSCLPLAGYAVYLWHADALGRYSLYSSGVTNQNYLRGVQETDDNGEVTFTAVFPGCYDGRWPHVHFEIYPSLSSATSAANKIATSQLAFPEDVCDEVYATSGYTNSAANLSRVSLASDGIFRDGYATQLATTSGDVANGYTATLDVAVNG